MRVDFYHLTQSPLERVLPSICEKLLAGGERLLIVAREDMLAQLDGLLWTYAPDSFLPHGRVDTPAAKGQPILLSSRAETASNGASNVALADGAWREEALAFARTFYFFDSAHLDDARGAWRALKARTDVDLRYWKQAGGGKWVEGP